MVINTTAALRNLIKNIYTRGWKLARQMTELPWTSFLPHAQSCWQQAEIFICIMPKQNRKLVEAHSCRSLFTPEGVAISPAWQVAVCQAHLLPWLQRLLFLWASMGVTSVSVCVKTGCTCTSPSLSWIYFSITVANAQSCSSWISRCASIYWRL